MVGIMVFCEIFLQVLSLVFPNVNTLLSPPRAISQEIKDERLGFRPNPKYPGHDKKGFRNKFVPEEVDIVAMGDSQTYGVSVLTHQAWPQQLEELSDIKTYNMAFGGYGPTHSLLLLEEAINLKPKLIIEAFYAGNDLYDSYSLIYNRGQLPELKTSDYELINSIVKLEKIEPLEKKIMRLLLLDKGEEGVSFLAYIVSRKFLSRHSKFYGLLRSLKNLILSQLYKSEESNNDNWESAKQYAMNRSERYQIFDNGEIKTVFISNYHSCAINLDDPRIVEGFRISLEAIRLINERTKEANITFIALLIPTKEMVFKDIVYKNSSNMPQTYKILIENEELFWQKTKTFLQNQEIYFIDTLPALRECIHRGDQPYKASRESHPNSIGNHAIAELVYSEIEGYDFKGIKH